MNEYQKITLRINGREYPLKVKREDEKIFRDAAVAIHRKISQYRNYFSGAETRKLEDTDYAIMTSIQAVSEYNELETENKIFEEKIIALTQELDEYLKK